MYTAMVWSGGGASDLPGASLFRAFLPGRRWGLRRWGLTRAALLAAALAALGWTTFAPVSAYQDLPCGSDLSAPRTFKLQCGR
jgi:hypothetical protein